LDYVTNLLRKEKVQEICCIQIPQEVNYADVMVIGTCLSEKHLNSTFININKKYKKFKQEDDLNLQRKSGKETKWCAIDTGRIVIHLFSEGFREFYDLESLWTCGPEFDDKYNDFLEEQREIEKKLIVVDDDSYNK
jgi:ribosome silencing factor RsfS/YbeB/iojap